MDRAFVSIYRFKHFKYLNFPISFELAKYYYRYRSEKYCWNWNWITWKEERKRGRVFACLVSRIRENEGDNPICRVKEKEGMKEEIMV